MLQLKLQYFSPLMQRAYSLGKPLILGKIEGRRRRGQHKMRWLNGITDSTDMSLNRLRETVTHRGAWRAAVHGAAKRWTHLSDWVTGTHSFSCSYLLGLLHYNNRAEELCQRSHSLQGPGCFLPGPSEKKFENFCSSPIHLSSLGSHLTPRTYTFCSSHKWIHSHTVFPAFTLCFRSFL